MSGIGFFLPIFIASCVVGTIILCLIEKMLEPKGSYEKWLEEKLKEEPDYINWLKVTNGGKDYHLGKRTLEKIERNQNRIYHKLFKR